MVKDLVRIAFAATPKKCERMVSWVDDPLFGLDKIFVRPSISLCLFAHTRRVSLPQTAIDESGTNTISEDDFIKNYSFIIKREVFYRHRCSRSHLCTSGA